MRAALIASSLRLAGAEKQFVYRAKALHEAGVDARVYVPGDEDHYRPALNAAGIVVRQFSEKSRPLLMLARLIKELHEFKPQVVVASQFGDLMFAGPAGRLCGALVIGSVRSDGFYELRTYGRRSGVMLRLAHGLIANSFKAKRNLAESGVDVRKVTVLPNVIDLAEFDAGTKVPLSNHTLPERPLVAAIGSLHPCKRFDRFLEALSLARDKNPNLFGIIVGRDLGAKADLVERARALGLWPENISFLGECEAIPALLSRCRLLCLTSEYEGFPNVILEAMAARLPVVTFPAGDAGHIVRDGVTGYVLPDGDCVGMAERIIELIDNPLAAAALGLKGRETIEEKYAFDSLSERLFETFRGFASKISRSMILPTQRRASTENNNTEASTLLQ